MTIKRKFWIRNMAWLNPMSVAIGIALFIYVAFTPTWDRFERLAGSFITMSISLTALFFAATQSTRSLVQGGDMRAIRVREVQNLARLLKRQISSKVWALNNAKLQTEVIKGFTFEETNLQIAIAKISEDDLEITDHLKPLEVILDKLRICEWKPKSKTIAVVVLDQNQILIRDTLVEAVTACDVLIKSCEDKLPKI